ncbi:MAG TPA: hypothetical protein P5136_02595 [Methanofastidiosum sp.]|nr:hypothetical protein [Methanofastidiosum sp.]
MNDKRASMSIAEIETIKRIEEKKEIIKNIIQKGKRNRTCSVCSNTIKPGEKHLSIPKGGYGNWNICKECLSSLYKESIK